MTGKKLEEKGFQLQKMDGGANYYELELWETKKIEELLQSFDTYANLSLEKGDRLVIQCREDGTTPVIYNGHFHQLKDPEFEKLVSLL